MQKSQINKRKIHRKVAALSAIPLLITLISGTAYSILQPLGVDAFWLIKWHTGNFGIFNLHPFYSIFLGITSIISVISGVKLLQKNSQNQVKLNLVNREERTKRFKSMSSSDRQKLILEKMKAKGIEVGSGVLNKKYNSEEIYELIHIANCIPELRDKGN